MKSTYLHFIFILELNAVCIFIAQTNSIKIWITALIRNEEEKDGAGRRAEWTVRASCLAWHKPPPFALHKASVGILAKGPILELPPNTNISSKEGKTR